MLGIIEIKSETPTSSFNNEIVTHQGGFLSINFKVEKAKDIDLLMDIFNEYMNSTFSGLPEEPKFVNYKLTLNEEQTIYYDYQTNEINIKS